MRAEFAVVLSVLVTDGEWTAREIGDVVYHDSVRWIRKARASRALYRLGRRGWAVRATPGRNAAWVPTEIGRGALRYHEAQQ